VTTALDSRSQDAPDRQAGPGGLGRVGPWVVAVVTLVVVYAAVSTGVMPRTATGLLLGGLILGLPSSAQLARRVALNGSLVLGWVPVLWWVDWPVSVNHGAAVLAVGSAALVVLGLATVRRGHPLHRLLPTCRRTDVLIILSGLAAFLVVSRLVLAGSARRVLTILLGGFDNGPHFGMYLMLRKHGATLDALGAAPDGSSWLYASYPQGFHAVVATCADLFVPQPGSGPEELVTYARCVAGVVTFAAMVLTGALVSLPGLRERPLIAFGAVASLCGAFLWEPGVNTLTDGFANFWLGAAAVSTALLLSVSSRGVGSLVEAAAVGGLVLVTAHSWIPLAVFGVPAALALLSRGDGPRPPWRARIRVLVPLLLAGLGSLGAAYAIVAGGVEVQTVVEAAGPIHPPSPVMSLALLVLSLLLIGAHAVATGRGHHRGETAPWRKVRLMVLVPALGSVVVGVLLAAQLRAIGTTSYYLVKFVVGFDLVLAATVAALGGTLIGRVVRVRPRSRPGTAWAAAYLAFAALLVGGTAAGTLPRIAPAVAGADSAEAQLRVGGMASHILAASRGESTRAALRTEYVAVGAGHAKFVEITDVWYHALTCSATKAVALRTGAIGGLQVTDPASAAQVVETALDHDRRVEVLVAERFVGSIRGHLPERAGAQVRGFPDPRQSSPRENADSRSC
jgi:hypothetical protein